MIKFVDAKRPSILLLFDKVIQYGKRHNYYNHINISKKRVKEE